MLEVKSVADKSGARIIGALSMFRNGLMNFHEVLQLIDGSIGPDGVFLSHFAQLSNSVTDIRIKRTRPGNILITNYAPSLITSGRLASSRNGDPLILRASYFLQPSNQPLPLNPQQRKRVNLGILAGLIDFELFQPMFLVYPPSFEDDCRGYE